MKHAHQRTLDTFIYLLWIFSFAWIGSCEIITHTHSAVSLSVLGEIRYIHSFRHFCNWIIATESLSGAKWRTKKILIQFFVQFFLFLFAFLSNYKNEDKKLKKNHRYCGTLFNQNCWVVVIRRKCSHSSSTLSVYTLSQTPFIHHAPVLFSFGWNLLLKKYFYACHFMLIFSDWYQPDELVAFFDWVMNLKTK